MTGEIARVGNSDDKRGLELKMSGRAEVVAGKGVPWRAAM
jgi:hypothetical protein